MVDETTPTGTSDQTPNPQTGAGADGQQTDDKGWREQNTRLRQEMAEQKELNRRAVPFVQVALALQKSDPAAYQKLLAGEPMTAKETKTVDAAASAAGLTVEGLDERLNTFGENLLKQQAADRVAADAMRKLDKDATEKLPGYDKLKGTPMWNGVLSSVLGSIENGTFQVPQDVTDPYWFAVEQTYNIIKAQNPEIAKGERQVAKTETDRAAEILAAGRKPSSSKQETDELAGLPDAERKEIEFIRGIGGQVGKKFSP